MLPTTSEDQTHIDFGVYGTDKTNNTNNTTSSGSQTVKTNYLRNPSIFKSITSDIMEGKDQAVTPEDLNINMRKESDLDTINDTPGNQSGSESLSRQQQILLEEALQDYTDESSMINKIKPLPEPVQESEKDSQNGDDQESSDFYKSPDKNKGDDLIDIIDGENDQKMEIEVHPEMKSTGANKPSSSDNFRPITEVTEDPSYPSISEGYKISDKVKSSKKMVEKIPESRESKKGVKMEQSGEQNKIGQMNLESIAKDVKLEGGLTKGISPKNTSDYKGDFQYEHVTELRNSRKCNPTGIENYHSEGNLGFVEEEDKMTDTGKLLKPSENANDVHLIKSALISSRNPDESEMQIQEEGEGLGDSNLERIRQEMEKIPQEEGSMKGIHGFLESDKVTLPNEDSKAETRQKLSSGLSETQKNLTMTDKLQVGYQLESELQESSEKASQENESMFRDFIEGGGHPKEGGTESNPGEIVNQVESLDLIKKKNPVEGSDKLEKSIESIEKEGNAKDKESQSDLVQSELLEGGEHKKSEQNYEIHYSRSTNLGQSDTIGESLLRMKELKEQSNFSSIGPKNFKSSEIRPDDPNQEIDLIHREMENENQTEESESEIINHHQVDSDERDYIDYEDEENSLSDPMIAQSLQVAKKVHFPVQENLGKNVVSDGKLLMSSGAESQEEENREEDEYRPEDKSFSSQNETEEIEITEDEDDAPQKKGLSQVEVDGDMQVINSMEGIPVDQTHEESESQAETHYKEKPFQFDDEISKTVETGDRDTFVEEISKPQSEVDNDLYPSKSFQVEKNTFKKMAQESLEEELGRNRLVELDNIRTTESRFQKMGSEGRDSSLKKSQTERDMSLTPAIEEKREDLRHSTPLFQNQKEVDEQNYMSKTMEVPNEDLMEMKLDYEDVDLIEREDSNLQLVKESTRYVQMSSGNLGETSQKEYFGSSQKIVIQSEQHESEESKQPSRLEEPNEENGDSVQPKVENPGQDFEKTEEVVELEIKEDSVAENDEKPGDPEGGVEEVQLEDVRTEADTEKFKTATEHEVEEIDLPLSVSEKPVPVEESEEHLSQETIPQDPVQFPVKDDENLSDKTIEKDIRFNSGVERGSEEKVERGEKPPVDESSETNILNKEADESKEERAKDIQINIPPASTGNSTAKDSFRKVAQPEQNVEQPEEIKVEDPSETEMNAKTESMQESELMVSAPDLEKTKTIETESNQEINLQNLPKIVSNLETKENVSPKMQESEDEQVEEMILKVEPQEESELEEPSEAEDDGPPIQDESEGVQIQIYKKKDLIAQMNNETPAETVEEEEVKTDKKEEPIDHPIEQFAGDMNINIFKTNPSPEIANSLNYSDLQKCESTDNANHYLNTTEHPRTSRFNRKKNSKDYRDRSVEFDDLHKKFIRSIKYKPPVIKSRSRSYTPSKKAGQNTFSSEFKTSILKPQKKMFASVVQPKQEPPVQFQIIQTRKYQPSEQSLKNSFVPPDETPKESIIKSKFIKGKLYNREKSTGPNKKLVILEENQFGLKVRRKSIEPGPRPFSKMKKTEFFGSTTNSFSMSQTIDLTKSLPNFKGATAFKVETSKKHFQARPVQLSTTKTKVNLPSSVNAKVIFEKQRREEPKLAKTMPQIQEATQVKPIKQKYILTRGRPAETKKDDLVHSSMTTLKEKYKIPLRISPAKYTKTEVKRYKGNLTGRTVQKSPIRSVSMEKPKITKIFVQKKAPLVQSNRYPGQKQYLTERKVSTERQVSTEVKKSKPRVYEHQIDLISDNCSEYKEEKSRRMNQFLKGPKTPAKIKGSTQQISSKYNSTEHFDSGPQPQYKSSKFQSIIEKERKKQIENVKTNKLSQSMATPSISKTIKKYGFTAKGISRITRGSPSPGRSRKVLRIENSRSPDSLYKKQPIVTSKRSAKIYNPGPHSTFRKATRISDKGRFQKKGGTPGSKYAKFKNVSWTETEKTTQKRHN